MKRMNCLVGILVFWMGLSACAKGSDAKKVTASGRAPAQTASAGAIEPGAYLATLECVDKSKAPQRSDVEMTYNLNADGTYTAEVKVTDSLCPGGICEGVISGAYVADKNKLTFNQKALLEKDQPPQVATDSFTFTIVSYIQEKGELTLQENVTIEACGGKQNLVLTKK